MSIMLTCQILKQFDFRLPNNQTTYSLHAHTRFGTSQLHSIYVFDSDYALNHFICSVIVEYDAA